MSNFTAYLLLSACFLALFFTGEALFKFFKVPAEVSRKFVHISSAILSCSFPFFFDSHWWVMAICFSFLVLLYLSVKFNFLKSINSVERKTFGSILYPIAIYICFILNQFLEKNNGQFQFYFASVLILGISDPLAAIVGGKYPIFRFQKIAAGKSLGGSLAFFIATFIISFSLLHLDNKIIICLAVSLLSTFAELLSSNGFDNLFVPLSCYLLFYLL